MVLAWEKLQEVFVMLVVVAVALPPWRFSFFIAFWRRLSFFRELSPVFYTHFILFQPSSSQSDLQHFHLTFLGLPRVLRFWAGVFYPQALFYLALLPYVLVHFVIQMRARTPHPGFSSVSTNTKLSFPADAWSWATHIVDTRPLVYQLHQWATKYKVTKLCFNQPIVVQSHTEMTIKKTC